MGLGDILWCLLLPPFASGVRERGCGAQLLVGLLWLCFWIPGSIAAFVMTASRPAPQQTIIIQQAPPPEPPKEG